MQLKFLRHTASLAAICIGLSGCATLSQMPAEPKITFKNFKAIEITADGLQFQVKMEVENLMAMDLPVESIDYALDLDNQAGYLTGRYNKITNFRPGQTQEVILPFLLTWEALVKNAVTENNSRWYWAKFRGKIKVKGNLPFNVVPFDMSGRFAIPEIPVFSFEGTEGSPFGSEFSVSLGIENKNPFAVTVENVEATMIMNGKNYVLTSNDSNSSWSAMNKKTLTLTMDNPLGKGVSMLANLISNQGKANIRVKGKIVFGTDFGNWTVPFETQGATE
jgi:LEA14-like dessication related protein